MIFENLRATRMEFVVSITEIAFLGLSRAFFNIYIFIAIALDETSILVAVDFSMKTIYQSCDPCRAVGRSNVDVSQ